MKCKEIQEKEKISLKLRNKKKAQKLKERGITLIALVVTIIILLILAGVTLNMAINGDGLFSRARNAADKYKKAQEDEADLISEIGKEMNSEYVGAYITGYEPTGGECTITEKQSGTDADQTFETTKETETGEKLKWRIWDYDGTTLRIILDKPTKQKLKLKGAAGYNNGVWAMNEICRQCFGQYDGKELKNGISVSNLKRSDIQKVCTYDYTKFTYNIKKSDNTNIEISFGESINYKSTDKINIPKIWYEIDSKWKYDYNKDTSEKDCLIWEKEGNIEERDTDRIEVNGESLNFKNSFYELKLKDTNEKFEDKEYLFHNKMYYDMLFTVKGGSTVLGAKYWLGTRTCSLSENHAAFGLQFVYDYAWSCSYGTFVMCTFENDNAIDEAESLRPLVSIDLNECGCSLERQSDGNYLISNLN